MYLGDIAEFDTQQSDDVGRAQSQIDSQLELWGKCQDTSLLSK